MIKDANGVAFGKGAGGMVIVKEGEVIIVVGGWGSAVVGWLGSCPDEEGLRVLCIEIYGCGGGVDVC